MTAMLRAAAIDSAFDHSAPFGHQRLDDTDASTDLRTETPEEILRSAVRVTRRLVKVSVAFAALARGAGCYEVVAREGLDDPRWDALLVSPGGGLGGTVLATKRPHVIDDYLTDPLVSERYRTLVRAEGLRALACAPVLSATGVAALIFVGERRVGGVTKPQFEELSNTASATGLVLATAAQHLACSRRLTAIAHIARCAAEGTSDPHELRTVLARIGAAANGQAPRDHPVIRVTPREQDVLGLLAEGASNRMIATRLVLSETTIKGYIHALLNKFQAASRLEIVAIARRHGMI